MTTTEIPVEQKDLSNSSSLAVPLLKKKIPFWRRSAALNGGIIIIALVVLFALFPTFVAHFSPNAQNSDTMLASPSWSHPFGTDNFGRDVLSRVAWGTRIDLTIGLLATAVPFIMGSLLGLLAGYYGGWIDTVLMRILDIVMAFPFIVLIISALDVSIQAQVINLLGELQRSLNLTLLFISHDLRVVRHVAHRVAVMYLGKIVELAPTEELFLKGYHPYSQILIKAAPILDPRARTREYAIEGEPPSPINVPKGCRFHPRCPYAGEVCRTEEPDLCATENGRYVACHFPLMG